MFAVMNLVRFTFNRGWGNPENGICGLDDLLPAGLSAVEALCCDHPPHRTRYAHPLRQSTVISRGPGRAPSPLFSYWLWFFRTTAAGRITERLKEQRL